MLKTFQTLHRVHVDLYALTSTAVLTTVAE